MIVLSVGADSEGSKSLTNVGAIVGGVVGGLFVVVLLIVVITVSVRVAVKVSHRKGKQNGNASILYTFKVRSLTQTFNFRFRVSATSYYYAQY